VIYIQGISSARGPFDYCAGYTDYECWTDIEPFNGEWGETDVDCVDVGGGW
jgi:hypothetical protein